MASKKKQERLAKIKQEKEEYIQECVDRAYQYESDALNDIIVVGNWIKKGILRERKLREKHLFKEDLAREVFDFFFFINITVKSKVQRYQPSGWQAWLVICVFSLFRKNNPDKLVRRYVTTWIARKSGKTTFSTLISLFFLVRGQRNAEVYFCGSTFQQASQSLRYAHQIISDSPALSTRIKKLQYGLRYDGKNGLCIAKPVASDADKLDGLFPAFAQVDECHTLNDKSLFQIMNTGMKASINPLIFQISTSGYSKEKPFFNDLEIGKRVLNQEIEDDTTFYSFFCLDSDEEVNDPTKWCKANPGITDGITDLEDLEVDFQKASLSVSDLIDFKVKNLNMYVDSETQWIADEDYKKCFKEVDIKSLLGKKCYLGLDLSTSTDLSSLVAVIEGDDGKMNVIPEAYFPGGQDRKFIRAGSVDLQRWLKDGHIQSHTGMIIDYDRIVDRIKWFDDNFDIQALAYDPWNATILTSKLESSDMIIEMVPFKQNASTFSYPLKHLERLIYSQKINMSKSPVLRWNFRNVVLYHDDNNNIKIAKKKSLDSVDLAVSLGMAIGMFCMYNFDSMAELMANLEQNTKTE